MITQTRLKGVWDFLLKTKSWLSEKFSIDNFAKHYENYTLYLSNISINYNF